MSVSSKAYSLDKKFLDIIQILYHYNNRKESLADNLNNL